MVTEVSYCTFRMLTLKQVMRRACLPSFTYQWRTQTVSEICFQDYGIRVPSTTEPFGLTLSQFCFYEMIEAAMPLWKRGICILTYMYLHYWLITHKAIPEMVLKTCTPKKTETKCSLCRSSVGKLYGRGRDHKWLARGI